MTDPQDRLTTPRVRVIMDDGAEHEVRVLNTDMVAFDRERGRHRDWPDPGAGPMLWATYLAWHALRRTGVHTMGLAEFEQRALQVEVLNNEAGGDKVDPTQRAAGPG